MKLALVAITKHGVGHALKLRAALPDAALYISEKQKGPGQEGASYFGTIKELTAELWDQVEGIVYVVSLGAVVRTIAPFLKNKDVDPAVVVVDDAGRFAISVLSGHVGGANEATEAIARALGATAIITTASDVRATIPVDILGRELGWTLDPATKAHVTPVSAAVVNEKAVALVQECGEKNWWTRSQPLPKNIVLAPSIADAPPSEAYLIVSDRSNDALKKELGVNWDKAVLYRPKSLCLGMGCDAGTDLEEAQALVDQVFAEAGLSTLSVKALASIDLKEGEEALRALAENLGALQVFYTRDALNARGTISAPNPVVEKYTGAVGVSEPSAMLAAGVDKLVVPKRKSQRATLAVARMEF